MSQSLQDCFCFSWNFDPLAVHTHSDKTQQIKKKCSVWQPCIKLLFCYEITWKQPSKMADLAFRAGFKNFFCLSTNNSPVPWWFAAWTNMHIVTLAFPSGTTELSGIKWCSDSSCSCGMLIVSEWPLTVTLTAHCFSFSLLFFFFLWRSFRKGLSFFLRHIWTLSHFVARRIGGWGRYQPCTQPIRQHYSEWSADRKKRKNIYILYSHHCL